MKRVTIDFSDEQFEVYANVTKQLNDFGIPVNENGLVKVVALNQKHDPLLNNYLVFMKTLADETRKKLRQKGDKGNDTK